MAFNPNFNPDYNPDEGSQPVAPQGFNADFNPDFMPDAGGPTPIASTGPQRQDLRKGQGGPNAARASMDSRQIPPPQPGLRQVPEMTAYEPTFGDRVNQGMRSLLEGTLLSSEEEAQGIRQAEAARIRAAGEMGVSQAEFRDPSGATLPAGRVVAGGVRGIVRPLAGATRFVERKTGIDTGMGKKLKAGAEMLTPQDPTVADTSVENFTSTLGLLIPGLGTQKAVGAIQKIPALAKLPGLMQAAGKWGGAVTMAAPEAAAEAEDVYDQLIAQGKSPEEASATADKVFWSNAAILAITDRIGWFDKGGRMRKAGAEAIQEGSQQGISNAATGRPVMEGVPDAAVAGAGTAIGIDVLGSMGGALLRSRRMRAGGMTPAGQPIQPEPQPASREEVIPNGQDQAQRQEAQAREALPVERELPAGGAPAQAGQQPQQQAPLSPQAPVADQIAAQVVALRQEQANGEDVAADLADAEALLQEYDPGHPALQEAAQSVEPAPAPETESSLPPAPADQRQGERRGLSPEEQALEVERRSKERRAQARAEAQAEKPVEDMTAEELAQEVVKHRREAMLDHLIPDMGNGRAFEREYQEGEAVGSLDAVGLKEANKAGQLVGDEYLVHIGKTGQKVAGEMNLKVYHRSGDEFLVRGGTTESLVQFAERVNQELAANPFTFVNAEGKTKTLTGELHHGEATTPEQADREMAAAKVRRAERRAADEVRAAAEERRGTGNDNRRVHGEEPRVQARGDQAPKEVAPPKKNPRIAQMERLAKRMRDKTHRLDDDHPEGRGATVVPSEHLKGVVRGQGKPMVEGGETKVLKRMKPQAPSRTYEDVQSEIDSIEDELELSGQNSAKMYDPKIRKAGDLPHDWVPMPRRLAELYRERNEIGAKDLKINLDEIKRVLRTYGIVEAGLVDSILNRYALGKTDAFAQYMASEHAAYAATPKMADTRLFEVYMDLARHRGVGTEDIDDQRDIFAHGDKSTLALAGEVVKSITELFHGKQSVDPYGLSAIGYSGIPSQEEIAHQPLHTPVAMDTLKGTAAATIQVQAETYGKKLESGWTLFAQSGHHMKLVSPDFKTVVFGPLLEAGMPKSQELRARAEMKAWADENPYSKAGITAVATGPDNGQKSAPPEKQASKPKKNAAVAKSEAEAALAEHFKPGNIIFSSYYREYDQVLEFRPGRSDRSWAVRVERVQKKGDVWVSAGDPRWHSTVPERGDYVVDPQTGQKKAQELRARGEMNAWANENPVGKGPALVQAAEQMGKLEIIPVTGEPPVKTPTPPRSQRGGATKNPSVQKMEGKAKMEAAREKSQAAFSKLMKIVGNPGTSRALVDQEAFDAAVELVVALTEEGVVRFQEAIERVKEMAGGTVPQSIRRYLENAWDAAEDMDLVEPRAGATVESLLEEPATAEPGIPGAEKAGMSVVKNWHAQNKVDVWVARMAHKVPDDVYNSLKAMAKAHGGYYSRYKLNGAIPGFIFKTETEARTFMAQALGKEAGHAAKNDGAGTGAAAQGPSGTGSAPAQPGQGGAGNRPDAGAAPKPQGPGPQAGSDGGAGRGTGDGGGSGVRLGGSAGERGGAAPSRSLRGGTGHPGLTPKTMAGSFSLKGGETRDYIENLNLTSERQKVEAARTHLQIIQTIKRLESEGRLLQATDQEKALLAKWVGWGALKDAVDSYMLRNVRLYRERGYELSHDMQSWAKTWETLTAEILAELTPSEIDAARLSTLNAHYTAFPIVEGMWDMIRGFGFEGGAMLEPSIGSGNFVGLMPADLRAKTSVAGAELDPMTAKVAQAIYPEAEIFQGDYEQAPIEDGSLDLVMSNVPFSREIRKDGMSLHNWFFIRGLKQLRPGGMMVAITSLGTMDSGNAKHREQIAKMADLVGAIRLPSNAFSKNAGTEVPTDILVFRKKDSVSFPAAPFQGTINVEVGKRRDGGVEVDGMNEYFAEHPEQILGEFAVNTMNGREGGMTIKWTEGQEAFGQAFQEALDRLPMGWAQSGVPTNLMGHGIAASAELLDGTLHRDEDGKAKVFYGGKTYTPAEWVSVRTQVKDGEEAPKPLRQSDAKAQDLNESALVYLDLKDAARALREAQDQDMTDEEVESLRVKAMALYDQFRNRGGKERPINSAASNPHIADDPDFFEVSSLENVTTATERRGSALHVTKTYSPADILVRRIGKPRPPVEHAGNLPEAATLSLLEKGQLDPEYMGGLLGISADEAEMQALVEGIAFIDPSTRGLVPAWQYLSGNIREKLEQAKAAAEKDPSFQRNVDKLQETRPKPKPITQITAKAGADWIPTTVVEDFTREVMGLETRLETEEVTGTVKLADKGTILDQALASKWAVRLDNEPGIAYPIDVLKSAISWNEITVEYEEKGTPKINRVLTAMARDKVTQLRNAFNEWLRQEGNPHAEHLERIYNDRFNVLVHPKMPQMPVTGFPGQATVFNGKPFAMEPYQVEGVFAGLMGNTLWAHVVGSGKTITGSTLAMELRRLGRANRVVIPTTRSVAQQFAAQARQLYPTARILVRPSTGGARARKTFMNRMATMDYDIAIITHEDLTAIPDNPIRVEAFVRTEKAKIEDAIRGLNARDPRASRNSRDPLVRALKDRMEWLDEMEDMARGDSEEGEAKPEKKGKARSKAKAAEKAKVARGRTLESLLARKTDRVLTWDDMKIDALIVDESHAFKRLDFWTQFTQLKGIDNDSSKRAMSVYLKTKALHERKGRIVFMTGTPITNTMAEIWTNVRYLRPDILESMGITEFDAFVKTFGEISSKPELNALGVFKSVQRLRRFSNVPELRQMLGQVMHRVVSSQIKRTSLPTLAGGAPQLVVSKPSTSSGRAIAYIRSVLARWETAGQVKMSTQYVPVVTYTRAAQAAIDPRLLDPTLPAPNGGKLAELADNLFRHYQESQDDLGAQVVFVEHYRSPGAYGPGAAFKMPEEDRFNMLKELKRMLVEKGIPADEIVEKLPDGDNARAKVFESVNQGKVRVIMGGTMNLGVGVNIQERLIAAHHLELATTPANQEQRNGRIIRAGNIFDPVHVYYYATEGSADAFFAQMLDNKKQFADQIMDMDAEIENEADDPGNISMSYEEIMAAFTGDQRVAQKIALQNQVNLLESERDSFNAAKRQAGYAILRLLGSESDSIAWRTGRAKAYVGISEQLLKDIPGLIEKGVAARFTFQEKDEDGKLHERLNTGKIDLPDGMTFEILDTKGERGGLGARWVLKRNRISIQEGNAATPSGLRMSLSREIPKIPQLGIWAQESVERAQGDLAKHQAMQGKEYGGQEKLDASKALLDKLAGDIDTGVTNGLREQIRQRMASLEEAGATVPEAVQEYIREADKRKAEGKTQDEIAMLQTAEGEAYEAMVSEGLTDEKRFTGSTREDYEEWFPNMMSEAWWDKYGLAYQQAVQAYRAEREKAGHAGDGEMGFARVGLTATVALTGISTVLVAGLTGAPLVAAAAAVGVPVAVALGYLVHRGLAGVSPNYMNFIAKARKELGDKFKAEAPKLKDHWQEGKDLAAAEDQALIEEGARLAGKRLSDPADVTRMDPRQLTKWMERVWKPWRIAQAFPVLKPVLDIAVKMGVRTEEIKHDYIDFLDNLKSLSHDRREAVTRAWNVGTRARWDEEIEDVDPDTGDPLTRIVTHEGQVYTDQELAERFGLNPREIALYHQGLEAGKKLAQLQIDEHRRRMDKLIAKLFRMLNTYTLQTGMDPNMVAQEVQRLKAAHTRALKSGDIIVADDLNLQIWALQESAAAGLSLRKWVFRKIKEMKIYHVRQVDTLTRNEAYAPLHRSGDQEAVIVDPESREALYVMAPTRWTASLRRALEGRFEGPAEASINLAIKAAAREYGLELQEGMVHKGTKYRMDPKLAALTSPLDPSRLANLIDSVTTDPNLVGVLGEEEASSLAELLKAGAQAARVKDYMGENRLRHHLIERKGTWGESLDGLAAWSSYVQAAAQSVASNENLDDLQVAVDRISKMENPRLRAYAENVKAQMIAPDQISPAVQNAIAVTALWTIGGKLSFAVQNASQFMVEFQRLVNRFGYQKAVLASVQAQVLSARIQIMQGLQKMGVALGVESLANIDPFEQIHDAKLRRVTRDAFTSGIFMDRVGDRISRYAEGKAGGKVAAAGRGTKTLLMAPASLSEQNNRIRAFIGYALATLGQDAAVSFPDLTKAAEDHVRHAHFERSSWNKSKLERSFGGLGTALTMFQYYLHEFVQETGNAFRVALHGEDEAYAHGTARTALEMLGGMTVPGTKMWQAAKGLRAMSVMMFALAGATGFKLLFGLYDIFKDFLSALYRWLFDQPYDPTKDQPALQGISEQVFKAAKAQGLTDEQARKLHDVVMHGATNAIGVDMSGSISPGFYLLPDMVQNPNARGADFMIAGLGVPGATGAKLIDAWTLWEKGEKDKALRLALPAFAKHWQDAATGKVNIGKRTMELTPTQRAVKATGFTPTPLAREYWAKDVTMQAQAALGKVKAELGMGLQRAMRDKFRATTIEERAEAERKITAARKAIVEHNARMEERVQQGDPDAKQFKIIPAEFIEKAVKENLLQKTPTRGVPVTMRKSVRSTRERLIGDEAEP